MSRWVDNLLLYCESGKKGVCPKCHGEHIEVIEVTNGTRESITFECKDCGAFEHFDGAKK